MLSKEAHQIYHYLLVRNADFIASESLQDRYPSNMSHDLRRAFHTKALKFEIIEDDLYKRVKQVFDT